MATVKEIDQNEANIEGTRKSKTEPYINNFIFVPGVPA